ncbi:transmembrane protein 135-like [Drosophila navojoa]|nr:transmembrane protein 135-like [Drosophila navojoa]
MWKTLQMLYNWGSEENILPKVPHFNMVLYASFTAVLFHCAILEANSIRNSYYKFLVNISGRRINLFDRRPFQSLGLRSHDRLQEVVKRLKIDMTNPLPIMPLTA